MNITDEHVAVLRAQLNADIDEYRQRMQELKVDPDRAGFNALLAAAFFLEIERRFPSEGDVVSSIIEFVGQVRAEFDNKDEWLDPTAAERLIRFVVLGEGEIEQFDAKTLGGLQIVLLTASIRDRGLSPEEIDAFLADVRQLAEA